MGYPCRDPADILCVLTPCGHRHTGGHVSFEPARCIVWTQALGALVREGRGPAACCHCCEPDKNVFGETSVNIRAFYLCVCVWDRYVGCKQRREGKGKVVPWRSGRAFSGRRVWCVRSRCSRHLSWFSVDCCSARSKPFCLEWPVCLACGRCWLQLSFWNCKSDLR